MMNAGRSADEAVGRWMSLDDYYDLIQRLEYFYSLEEAELWMHSPHPQLEGRRPVYCGHAEVLRVIERLDETALSH